MESQGLTWILKVVWSVGRWCKDYYMPQNKNMLVCIPDIICYFQVKSSVSRRHWMFQYCKRVWAILKLGMGSTQSDIDGDSGKV
jgi:hypothetical protein